MARSTATQVTQIGKEVTPGTVVPASKKLSALGLALNPSVESEVFRPKGFKYPTLVQANKEWAAVSMEGAATYDEIVYPLASVLGQPVVAQIMDGATQTGAYRWTFSPSSSGIDTPQTYTVEEGDATIAERAGYVLFTDFDLDISRSEVQMGGEGIAQRLEKGVALTAGATPVSSAVVPILPGTVCIYVADTPAALDVAGASDPAKRFGTALAVHPQIGGRFDPIWYLNCTLNSFGGHVETPEPDATVDFTVEANAAGLAWLDNYRAGKTQFLRIESIGPMIYDGATTDQFYRLRMDFAVKASSPGEKSDEDGVYAIAPELQVVHDPAWGKAMSVEVINKVAAL